MRFKANNRESYFFVLMEKHIENAPPLFTSPLKKILKFESVSTRIHNIKHKIWYL